MQKITLNQYTIIPHQLWLDVDVIIDYVTHYPFLTPTHCKHCESKHFRLSRATRTNKNNIVIYYCFSCKRKFTQLTNTPFMRMTRFDLWAEFAIRRISGKSTTQIIKEIPLSLTACTHRSKVLECIMAELTPTLYRWWKPRQDYLEHQMPIQVDVEYKKIISWLQNIIETTRAPCPHCYNQNVARVKTGNPDASGIRHRHRPYFYCGRCKQNFNLLDNSPLKKLNKIDKWPTFLQALVEGKSNYQLAEQFDISVSSITKWRQCFTKQMQQMRLTKLINWVKWRRSRAIAYSSQKTKENLKKLNRKQS